MIRIPEDQRVIATLSIVPRDSTNGIDEKALPQEPNDEVDPEPPPWLEVEQDVYFPMTVPEILLEIKAMVVERGAPTIILPAELPEE